MLKIKYFSWLSVLYTYILWFDSNVFTELLHALRTYDVLIRP